MFRGTDNISQNILVYSPPFSLNIENILWNIVGPTKHCYEHCYRQSHKTYLWCPINIIVALI